VKLKTIIIFCLVSAALFVAAGPSFARNITGQKEALEGLSKGEIGRVVRVIDGDSFILEGGLRVTLAGVQAPKRAWPEKDLEAWPLAEQSRAALAKLIMGRRVQLYYGGDKRDRYGRAPAQVWALGSADEQEKSEIIWVQEAMAKAGLVRVYTWPGQKQNTKRLYRAEILARADKRGIWDGQAVEKFYDVRGPAPNPLAQYVDSVQIVEGIIIDTADVRGTVFLNFGSDYKTDFTIGIAKKNRKAFTKTGLDPLSLSGARVRVRGWIELGNGPIIWLQDPNRLEVLD